MIFRFAIVGGIAFGVDWLVVTLLLGLGCPFPVARAGSYLSAASSAWLLNRIWTFTNRNQNLALQWLKYLFANLIGGAVNYTVSVGLSLIFPSFIGHLPVFALLAGTLSGLAFNFLLSKKYVFNS
ncbi:GtrA family protein [Martelella sp. FOR1707]